MRRGWGPAVAVAALSLAACGGEGRQPSHAAAAPPEPPSPSSPPFRNVATPTAYVGDAACAACHTSAAAVYRQHPMAQSFHQLTPPVAPLDSPLYNAATGFSYTVLRVGSQWYQEEYLEGPAGKRLHDLRRRMDFVMGSGHVGRTYFTAQNGRLFQLPLTWYRQHGWDFSPGYEINNARFDRVLPDRCLACHGSYPRPIPFLEGKYAALPPGIGCERCHGPGALHVAERQAGGGRRLAAGREYDNTIVNPARLPLERRLDVCEQCHVHTTVTVLREGRDAFSYLPSQPLSDQVAFFKVAGSIDIVSHADRLRQSACFIATRGTPRPLECATCHDPHQPPPALPERSRPCVTCHAAAALAQQLAPAARRDHIASADCVGCHMPRVRERVPHSVFTDHWIRVVTAPLPPQPPRRGAAPIEAYFERDRAGPEAAIYQGMGAVVYASLANDGRVLAKAAAALQGALGDDTTRGEAHFLLGLAYRQMGKTDAALRALEQAVRIDSNRPDRLQALARVYERAGRPAAAIAALYRRALELQPALAWIRADYADFLHAQGWELRADAESAYRTALAEQPSLDVAWFNLGVLLTEEGRLPAASDAFRNAVQLNPFLAEALSDLVEIGTTPHAVLTVRTLGAPLETMPVRARPPGAVQLVVTIVQGRPAAVFFNLPRRSSVEILEPDGTVVRALPAGDQSTQTWDLYTERGDPVAGGLYRVRVTRRGAAGQPETLQMFSIGIVRRPVG